MKPKKHMILYRRKENQNQVTYSKINHGNLSFIASILATGKIPCLLLWYQCETRTNRIKGPILLEP